ncbi:MAG: EscU/YscU/HrcU family type III secretion system export apparatus switch protein [Thermodesulfovibrionales bacterium]|nr:EscU/YscU/HrcU family type III secretion system export apparatus switch protein [Thermodesulfovibrionales bacterium]
MSYKRIKAIALKYRHKKDFAPKVVAKGTGKIAETIIAIANEYGIPIQNDPYLVEALSKLDFYEEIPPELYRAVAEVLIFVYKMSQKAKS